MVEDAIRRRGQVTTLPNLVAELSPQGITKNQLRNALFRLRKRDRIAGTPQGRYSAYRPTQP